METMTNVSKGTVDAKTRELNFKAQQAAKADIKKEISHNIVTGKPLTPTKSEEFDVEKNAVGVKQHNTGKPKGKAVAKVDAPAVKKEAKPQLAKKIDELIEKGGKWEDLIAEATEFCKVNELKSKITQGSFKTQIYWRRQIQKQESYAADKVLTEKGIEKVKAPAKPKAKK